MANSEQLELLRSGAQAWNAWRTNNPDTKVDLRQALLVGFDLRQANLSDADLSQAHLGGAYLDRAKLTGAKIREGRLFRAHLGGADLKGADLQGADLGGAHLSGADLTNANLSKSRLRGANLYGAALTGANLSSAQVGRTIFGNVDLRDVNGLEEIEHAEASTVGLDTYLASKGQIPEAFLIGAGIPREIIGFLTDFGKHATAKTPKPSKKTTIFRN